MGICNNNSLLIAWHYLIWKKIINKIIINHKIVTTKLLKVQVCSKAQLTIYSNPKNLSHN